MAVNNLVNAIQWKTPMLTVSRSARQGKDD